MVDDGHHVRRQADAAGPVARSHGRVARTAQDLGQLFEQHRVFQLDLSEPLVLNLSTLEVGADVVVHRLLLLSHAVAQATPARVHLWTHLIQIAQVPPVRLLLRACGNRLVGDGHRGPDALWNERLRHGWEANM